MKWSYELSCRGLCRTIEAEDPNELAQKAIRCIVSWMRKGFSSNSEPETGDVVDVQVRDHEDFARQIASGLTVQFEKKREKLKATLKTALTSEIRVHWVDLTDTSTFLVPTIEKPKLFAMWQVHGEATPTFAIAIPEKPKLSEIPREPRISDREYAKARSLREWINSKVHPRHFERRFEEDHRAWQEVKRVTENENATLVCDYEEKVKRWEVKRREFHAYLEADRKALQNYEANLERVEELRAAFYENQKPTNDRIYALRAAFYDVKSPDAIIFFFGKVLEKSAYSCNFTRKVDLEYKLDTKLMMVDYLLPSIDDMPRHKKIRYDQARDEMVETFIPEKQLFELYDDVLYQIVLRSIYELFAADDIEALDTVVFNGWVHSIDGGTGKEVNACILSVQTRKKEFSALNLERIDPKACFKSLKGVGSSKLHSLAAVPPIMQMSREDRRFVPSYNVVDQVDEKENLAAMDWLDFENLIRGLFEKEFSSNGGEVKITQASRDGGVDAIAFDPDPIRGGKMVIQAKRYTNVVGVSAVRDLYGTLINEGATKGILVTTSEFGPDAYEFAKGKPLTLLTGGNLLALLEKHGHRAKIDLKDAKRILEEKDKQHHQGRE
ncbi:MAG: restriction endonuclease [Ignavibacteria bacterium]|nr:restriction endonuclease [Ignavibacteria bacterium]